MMDMKVSFLMTHSFMNLSELQSQLELKDFVCTPNNCRGMRQAAMVKQTVGENTAAVMQDL